MTRQPVGLYRQLTVRLLLPMLAIVAVGSAIGLYTAHRQASIVFDRWLLDAAVSLAEQVHVREGESISVDLPPAAARMLAYDEVDDVYFSVQQGHRILIGGAELPAPGIDVTRYASGLAYDAVVAGKPVRVAVVSPRCAGCESIRVLVAETLHKRERADESQLWFLAPMILLLAATAGAIFFTVQRTVRPLQVLARHWERESHHSLQPIPEHDLPLELLPFANALNDLLGRIRAMVSHERQFAATAAHQVRTSLAGLRLGLERARAASDIDYMRRVLAELDASTAGMARMVQQLLLMGRVDPQGRPAADLQAVDLVATVQEVCGLHVDAAQARHISLELQRPGHAVTVFGHAELIAESLANLLDNALQATPADRRVLVTVDDDPPRFGVEDGGPGLAAEERERAFERFFRGSQVSWPGTGLGLAIVRDIATQHGATVSVGVGRDGGARFDFVFPTPLAGQGVPTRSTPA